MFDEAKGITKKMREKEAEQDYRFISDPDLPAIEIKNSRIERIRKSIPETPQDKLQKLIKKYNIEKRYAEVLTKNIDIAEFFEKVAEKVNPKLASRWVITELLSILNYNKKELDETNITPERFINLLKHIENGTMTELSVKDNLRGLVKKIPVNYTLQLKDSVKISEKSEIEKICKEIIKENPNAVSDFKNGRKESLNFLIGKVMQKTNKRADFRTAKDILEKLIK